ncbi:MAG: heme-binding domain-containing protein [Cytophagales bacterium]|nr:heme-binding domain-containing protein [Cytophagales bacterium]
MKRLGILLVISAFTIAVFIQMNITGNTTSATTDEVKEGYKFPKKVKAVIDKSCYGCHSEKGKSDDAKEALRWDLMDEYDKSKLVSVMDEIIEVVEKQEMPPKKMLEKKPDLKPSEKEYETLAKWAEKEADKLLD